MENEFERTDLHSVAERNNNSLAAMTYSVRSPATSNRHPRVVAFVLVLALGGGLELLNNGRPFPSRLLGTWQEEEEAKGAKTRDGVGTTGHSLARRRSPRPPAPVNAVRPHVLPELVATDRASATTRPLRSGPGQYQRC